METKKHSPEFRNKLHENLFSNQIEINEVLLVRQISGIKRHYIPKTCFRFEKEFKRAVRGK